jgi:hypothetical protein
LAKNAKSGRRWTFAVPDDVAQPRGSNDFLKRAVERLGPFEQRWSADAEKHGPWGGLRGRTPLSEELATEEVQRLAVAYNRHANLEANAPRSKQVVEWLTKAETLTGELARHFRSSDDETRRILQTAGSGIRDFLKHITLDFEPPSLGLPIPDGHGDSQTGWIFELEALSRYLNVTVDNFLYLKAIDDVDAPDKGGNTNLYKQAHGAARWHLVNEAWHIHELFKPGTSTGTEGGPFQRFAMDVFEYATGQEQEQHSKLMPWVKHVSKVNREARELTKRELSLIKFQGRIESDTKLTPNERKQRLAEIDAELISLQRERQELWPQMYPFAKSATPGHRPGQ